MDAKVATELESLLSYAEACRMGNPDGSDPQVTMLGGAYVGGALTTLSHLQLLDAAEEREWTKRLLTVMGHPAAGDLHG